MDSIRLQRLRCLSDTGEIKIKPITVLVGENSSGKSTFLRFFPLLKQSVESRTIGPVLWNGRLVDFGNYEDARQKNSEEDICLEFKFEIIPSLDRRFVERERVLLTEKPLYIAIKLHLEEDKKQLITKTHKLCVTFADSNIYIEIDKNDQVSNFKVNSLDILKIFGDNYVVSQLGQKAILPQIREIINNQADEPILMAKMSFYMISRRRFAFQRLFNKLFEKTKKKAHHSTSDETILKMITSFRLGYSERMLEEIKNNNVTKSWKKKVDSWTLDSKEFIEFRDLIIANSVPWLLEQCDELLGHFSTKISYMGPVRATAERYYRTQDLAVDEVDYQGVNLPMVLRNLTKPEQQRFGKWTLNNFGFETLIKPSRGLISLEIRSSKNSQESFNVADTGFGFSQILPIITQLWFLSEFTKVSSRISPRRLLCDSPIVFAIEQPELHLHPRLQGVLTEVFVKSIQSAKERGIDLRLVIETHSEVLINKLGYLVAEKRISSEDINIVLFDKLDHSKEIKVRTSQFDSEGYLSEDWPLGFFDMDLL